MGGVCGLPSFADVGSFGDRLGMVVLSNSRPFDFAEVGEIVGEVDGAWGDCME